MRTSWFIPAYGPWFGLSLFVPAAIRERQALQRVAFATLADNWRGVCCRCSAAETDDGRRRRR